MSGYSASEMKECPWTLFDLGVCFLIEDAFWTCYTWVFCMLRENREVNSSFPKKEGWGSFLAIKIQRELKDEIPLHLFLHLANGHFSACVTDLAPFRSPQTAFLYYQSWEAGNPVPQTTLQLPGTGTWPGFHRSLALPHGSDVEVSSARGGRGLGDWTTGRSTGPFGKHRGTVARSSGEMGRNFDI